MEPSGDRVAIFSRRAWAESTADISSRIKTSGVKSLDLMVFSGSIAFKISGV
jgi:hypothetical protein